MSARHASAPVPPRPPRRDRVRRLPAVAAVAAVVAAVVALGLTVDRRDAGSTSASAAAPRPSDLAPVAPPADAMGSTWYCAAGTGSDGTAPHIVRIANPGDAAVAAEVTVIAGGAPGEAVTAQPVTEEVDVPAGESVSVSLPQLLEAAFVAAVVEASAGEVVVEHTVGASPEIDAAPCASTSSDSWYLAAGATTRDAIELLVLFNPFPDDAVVDVTFTTPDGLRSPPAFSGFIVPGRRVVAVDVGAVVSRHANVSTSVVARSGRLVVERLQRFDATGGAAGLALTGAAPNPALVWSLPEGVVGEGTTETITVFNPTEQQAEVDVEVILDPTSDPAIPASADPFVLSIAPQQYAQVAVRDDGRVPDDVGHALTVRSQNGVPVVAEQWIRSGSPAARTGFTATLGSPIAATRWLSGVGSTVDGGAAFLSVVNPATDAIARISVQGRGVVEGLDDLEVPEAGRLIVDVGQALNAAGVVLVVESTLPVVVERSLFPNAAGSTRSILVPTVDTATVLQVNTGEAGVP